MRVETGRRSLARARGAVAVAHALIGVVIVEAGMNSRNQAGVARDSGEQANEFPSLRIVERSREFRLMVCGYGHDRREGRVALAREVECIRAAVSAARAALDPASRFQPIDDADDPTRGQTDRRGDL